eukprot:5004433-Prymnesium_polylepis.2
MVGVWSSTLRFSGGFSSGFPPPSASFGAGCDSGGILRAPTDIRATLNAFAVFCFHRPGERERPLLSPAVARESPPVACVRRVAVRRASVVRVFLVVRVILVVLVVLLPQGLLVCFDSSASPQRSALEPLRRSVLRSNVKNSSRLTYRGVALYSTSISTILS